MRADEISREGGFDGRGTLRFRQRQAASPAKQSLDVVDYGRILCQKSGKAVMLQHEGQTEPTVLQAAAWWPRLKAHQVACSRK